jgi:hypothetical protein
MDRRKNDPLKGGKEASHKPSFAKDRVDRGLEADDTKPLYADESKHGTREQKFALDSDAAGRRRTKSGAELNCLMRRWRRSAPSPPSCRTC